MSDPIAAGVAVLALDTGRILMLQRCLDENDPAGGMWEVPGGCIDPGETPAAAACREFGEETGASCPPLLNDLTWISPNGKYQLFCAAVEAEDDVHLNLDHEDRMIGNPDDPDGHEIEVLAWWDPDLLVGNPALRTEARGWFPFTELKQVPSLMANEAITRMWNAFEVWKDEHADALPAQARRSLEDDEPGGRPQMSVLIETPHSVWLGAQAWIVQNEMEMAWAENFVIPNPAYKYILGRYAAADENNQNGQYFPLDDLRDAQASLRYAPLNINHDRKKPYGTYVASDLIYPMTQSAADGPTPVRTPYMEALAAFWQNLYPDEFKKVEQAQAEGALFYSQECFPETVTCQAAECGKEFPYRGPRSPEYCAHLNGSPVAKRSLNKPRFVGGALIVPPVRPGWRQADITSVSALVAENAELAESFYRQLAGELPHLEPAQWEAMMFELLMSAVIDPNDLHNYKQPVDGPADGNCDICDRPMDDKIHGLDTKA